MEEASLILNMQKKLYRALVNVMTGTDKQTTPHHRFLFHTHYQDTILLHIYRTYLSLSIMPRGELNSLDFSLLKCPLKNSIKRCHVSKLSEISYSYVS